MLSVSCLAWSVECDIPGLIIECRASSLRITHHIDNSGNNVIVINEKPVDAIGCWEKVGDK